jgi:tetratricopeptide (TPR) repeat protein
VRRTTIGLRTAGVWAGLVLALFLLGPGPGPAGAAEPRATAAFERAQQLYLAHGRADEAVVLLSHAVGMDPSFKEAYLLLATILSRQGKLEKALEAMNRALASSPGDPALLSMQSAVFLDFGKAEEAARVVEDMRRLAPGDPYTLWASAQVAGRTGDLEGKKRSLLELLEQEGMTVQMRHTALRDLAATAETLEDDETARLALGKLVDLDREPETVRKYLRFLMRTKTGADLLIAHGRALVEGVDTVGEDYLLLATGLLWEGMAEEALRALAEGRDRFGGSALLELRAAETYLTLGYADLVLERLEAGRELGADAEEVDTVKKKAQGLGNARPYAGPVLAVEPEVLEAGFLVDGEKWEGTLRLANRGKAPLTVERSWVTDLPWRIVELSSEVGEIPPGGEAEVGVRLFADRGPFPLYAKVSFLTNDLSGPVRTARLKAEIGPDLMADLKTEPRTPLNLGEIEGGREVVQDFVLTNVGNRTMRILEVRVSRGVAYEGFEASEIPPGGTARITVRWTPRTDPGLASGRVSLWSNDTLYRQNPIMMMGTVRGNKKDKEEDGP